MLFVGGMHEWDGLYSADVADGGGGGQYSHEKDSQQVTKPTIVISRHGILLFVYFITAVCGLKCKVFVYLFTNK